MILTLYMFSLFLFAPIISALWPTPIANIIALILVLWGPVYFVFFVIYELLAKPFNERRKAIKVANELATEILYGMMKENVNMGVFHSNIKKFMEHCLVDTSFVKENYTLINRIYERFEMYKKDRSNAEWHSVGDFDINSELRCALKEKGLLFK